jgi:hypothetical protein
MGLNIIFANHFVQFLESSIFARKIIKNYGTGEIPYLSMGIQFKRYGSSTMLFVA